MTLYNVTIHPLRLVAHFCRRGSLYIVVMSRRGVELTTKPATCTVANEVVFSTPAELNQTQTFQLSFRSPKDRRTIHFTMYDVTNPKHSVRIAGFEIPLAGMCSVLAGESICERKAVSFRISGRPGRLDVIFRMHPTASPVPPLTLFAGPTTGSGGVGAHGDVARLPARTVQILKNVGVLPNDVEGVEVDAPVAQEVVARISMLFPSEAELRERVLTLEREVAQQEYSVRYASKDSVSSGSAACNALRNELQYWKAVVERVNLQSAQEAGIALLLKAGEGEPNDSTRALIADVEGQLAQARKELKSIEKSQNDEDLNTKLIPLLGQVEQLEELLTQLRKDAQLSAGKSTTTTNEANIVDQWEKLARELFDKELTVERLMRTVLTLNQLQFEPYPAAVEVGAEESAPCELQFVRDNKRQLKNLPQAPSPTPIAGTDPASAGPTSDSLLSDIFGFSSPSQVAPEVSARNTEVPSRQSLNTEKGDFIGGGSVFSSGVEPIWGQKTASPPQSDTVELGKLGTKAVIPEVRESEKDVQQRQMDTRETPTSCVQPPPVNHDNKSCPGSSDQLTGPPGSVLGSPFPSDSQQGASAAQQQPFSMGSQAQGTQQGASAAQQQPFSMSSQAQGTQQGATAAQQQPFSMGSQAQGTQQGAPTAQQQPFSMGSQTQGTQQGASAAQQQPFSMGSQTQGTQQGAPTAQQQPFSMGSQAQGTQQGAPTAQQQPFSMGSQAQGTQQGAPAAQQQPFSMGSQTQGTQQGAPTAQQQPFSMGSQAQGTQQGAPTAQQQPFSMGSQTQGTQQGASAAQQQPFSMGSQTQGTQQGAPAAQQQPFSMGSQTQGTQQGAPTAQQQPFSMGSQAQGTQQGAPTAQQQPFSMGSQAQGTQQGAPTAQQQPFSMGSQTQGTQQGAPTAQQQPFSMGSQAQGTQQGAPTAQQQPFSMGSQAQGTQQGASAAQQQPFSMGSQAQGTQQGAPTAQQQPFSMGSQTQGTQQGASAAQQQFVAPPEPPVPRYVRRPLSSGVAPFAPFINTPLVGRACPLDIYLDGRTPTRGTEITIQNNGNDDITIGGVELRQEDMTSTSPVAAQIVPIRRWPEQMYVRRGGERATCVIALHPSYPRGSSLILLVVVYVLNGSHYIPFAARFPV